MVSLGHLRVTIGHSRVTVGHPRVTVGHPRVTRGNHRLNICQFRFGQGHLIGQLRVVKCYLVMVNIGQQG